MAAAKTILIVDDDHELSDGLRAVLENQGFRVIQARDGQQGKQMVYNHRPDLMILDMMMPRRSGLEVLSAMRQEEELADIRVIVLTAQPATREQALSAGADIVMVKPFEPEQIAAAVEEVLADKA